jgi:hypothetical protein
VAGPVGATGATGAPGYTFGTMTAPVGSATAVTTNTQVLSAGQVSGTAFVNVTLRVTSTRAAGTGLWVGYAECSWTGAATGSAARVPIIYNAADPYSNGSTVTAMAQLNQGSTGLLRCSVTEESSVGSAPTISVLVAGAMSLSVNAPDAGYTAFS